LLENEQAPTFDAVRDLQVPVLGRVNVDLDAYDQLLPSQQRRAHG
jgi:hypothetical protein